MQTPDALFVLSGGSVSETVNGTVTYRSTTYEERDAFGTLGGYVRVEAAALLAQQYSDAMLITTTKRMDPGPTHAWVDAQELIKLGVAKERIILEENSTVTGSKITEAIRLCKEHGWTHIAFVTSEYHIPRTQLFWEQQHVEGITADFISAEAILTEEDPSFAATFEVVKNTPAYHTRLESEAQGIADLKKGTYQAAPVEQKLERKQ